MAECGSMWVLVGLHKQLVNLWFAFAGIAPSCQPHRWSLLLLRLRPILCAQCNERRQVGAGFCAPTQDSLNVLDGHPSVLGDQVDALCADQLEDPTLDGLPPLVIDPDLVAIEGTIHHVLDSLQRESLCFCQGLAAQADYVVVDVKRRIAGGYESEPHCSIDG